MRPCFSFLLALLAGVSSLHAQTPAQPQRGPDSGSKIFVPGIDILPLPGMPFTGRGHTTVTRTTENGVTITTYLEANAGRDSQGRVYRERHRFGPDGVNPQTTLYASYVLDPIARTRTECDYATHRCTIANYRPQLSFAVVPAGPFDKGQRFLTRENLGDQTIEGLPVVGTRETINYAPGSIGNNQSVSSSREFWYSPDLKINLAVIRKEPREGTTTIHFTVYSRGEPDPAIFAVPPGFTVQDARHPK
jgi:hypothetical protein